MPIYEYRCQSCGHQQEFLQKLSDPLLTECPQCKEPALKKKMSAAGFRLKGGGWYETDFKSGNKKNVASGSGDGGGSAQASETGGGKSETKTDAGSDSKKAESKPSTTASSSPGASA